MNAGFETQGSLNPDKLFSGDFPAVTKKETIITGQNLTRGAVLGQITTGGKLNLSLSAAVDGSQAPYAVLAEAVDATAADKEALVYLTGEFKSSELVFGTAHTATSARAALRQHSIFI